MPGKRALDEQETAIEKIQGEIEDRLETLQKQRADLESSLNDLNVDGPDAGEGPANEKAEEKPDPQR